VRRGLKLAAGLAVVMLVAGCMTVPEDARLAGLGADALEAGDYAAAEQHLTKALRVNPTNEHALLNLGVVYHNTDRPELARKTYAEIVRLNRAESAVQVIARQTQGPAPVDLARQNIADLNLSPVAVFDQPASMVEGGATLGPVGAVTLYTNMSDMYERLQALVQSMGTMSDTLRVAARDVDAPDRVSNNEAAAMPKTGPDHADEMMDKPAGKASHAEAAPAMSEHKMVHVNTPPPTTIGENDNLVVIASAKAIEPAAGAVRIHIASFRSAQGAEQGWTILRQSHHDLLGGLASHVRKIDFGADMGVFYRLQAGPIVTELAAKDLCRKLKGRGLYCSVAFF